MDGQPMEDDEDVIFENSPIYQAMKEAGVEDIEAEPLIPKVESEDSEPIEDEQTTVVQDNKNHRLPTNFLTRLFLSQTQINHLHMYYRKRTLSRLKSSSLLSYDDRCFLRSFIDEDVAQDNFVEEFAQTSWWFLLNFHLVCCTCLCTGIAARVLYLFMMFGSQLGNNFNEVAWADPLIHHVFLGPAIVIAIVICLLKFILYSQLCDTVDKMDDIIQKFEEGATLLSQIEKKCVKRIRESELIARGFTLASLSTGCNTDSPLLGQIDKWCPDLRAAIFDGNVDVTEQLKKSYKFLCHSIPLIVDFNWVDIKPVQKINHHGSLSSSMSSSSGLNRDNASTSEDGECDGKTADNLSGKKKKFIPTSQLVSSNEILSHHISAFMRRLVLSFYIDNYKDTKIDPFVAASTSVQSCQQSVDSITSKMSVRHSFYRAIHKSLEQPEMPATQAEDRNSKSFMESFFICVNSLDLHLLTAFNKTRKLGLDLEGLTDEQMEGAGKIHLGDDNVSSTDRESWERTLKAIKTSLDSCKSCYEEGMKLLSRTWAKSSPTTTLQLQPGTSNDLSCGADASDGMNKPVRVIPDCDPVIEDQVFEAVIDADEVEETPVKPTYTVEEKAQFRQQREDLSRFKQELKAVVDHRAIDQRKREEKALVRTQGKESSAASSETGDSLQSGDGDDEGEGGSVGEGKKKTERSASFRNGKTELHQASEGNCDKVSSHSGTSEDDVSVNRSKHDEKSSMLAAKLDTAVYDPSKHSPDGVFPWASVHNKKTNGPDNKLQSFTSAKSKKSSARSQKSASAMPFDEGWKSSVERSKARHWEMCEKIIQESKEGNRDEEEDKPDPAESNRTADLDTSSYVDISCNDILLLYPPVDVDTETYPEDGACAARVNKDSTDTSNSQILLPHKVNPEEEGFRHVNGAYVSRHNFTASEKNFEIDRALRVLEHRNKGSESLDEDDDDDLVALRNPNRRRHCAERQEGKMNGKWVNISHMEFVSGNGNQYEVFRQKEMTANDIVSRCPIPSPDPCSSLNASLAFMAAARSRQFNLGVEEQYNDDGEADEVCDALCSTEIDSRAREDKSLISEVA